MSVCFGSLLCYVVVVAVCCVGPWLGTCVCVCSLFFFFQAEDGIRDWSVTGVQTCALPICSNGSLFRNGWFQWFSVWELKVPTVPYLELGGSNVFLFRN